MIQNSRQLKMTPNSRRMRRTRLGNSSEEFASSHDHYNIQGETQAALDAIVANPKEHEGSVGDYNLLVLRQIASQPKDGEEFIKLLENFESSEENRQSSNMLSTRKRERNNLIMAYNRALVFQASGDTTKCVEICSLHLSPLISSKKKLADDFAAVASRMGLLLLESILALSVGRNSGLDCSNCPSVSDIVKWLDGLESENDPQLKFLLALYRSRVDLAQLEVSGKHSDSRVRSARKELKTAMEVFQQKLRPSFGGDTGSVVSSANSEENNSFQEHQQQPPPSSLVLQKYNQSALSLKANLEQLKGNTKKSLILCGEAQTAAKDDGAYNAIHENNLAVVYETNNKRHLALHALTKGLRAESAVTSIFQSDGTARPDATLNVLHNTALCALQARNYLTAYECMVVCLTQSDVFRSRPRCWLRLSEACIGLYSDIKRQKNIQFVPVELQGEPRGIVADSAMLTDDIEVLNEALVESLGSAADMEQVQKSPLLRARAALEHVFAQEEVLDADTLTSARLSMAYVSLVFGDYKKALSISRIVLERTKPQASGDEVISRLHDRQAATARMYAAEASCALGQMVEAMKLLVGDGKEDAFDRLASELGGVTLETAAGNGKGKRRLAKAQTMVRSSACAVTAAMGNTQAAKQLANSANAMEDAFASNRERSSARRALIFTLLRDGHQAQALNLIASLR